MVLEWQDTQTIGGRAYICGHCGAETGSKEGFTNRTRQHQIYLCPICDRPTYFDAATKQQIPGVPYGDTVTHLPPSIQALYAEARNCMAVSAYTGAAMLARTLLAHIAVQKGAAEKKPFGYYIDYLVEAGQVAPASLPWVKRIRDLGNQAVHDIEGIDQEDAQDLMIFLATLLRNIFENPARLSRPPKPPKS